MGTTSLQDLKSRAFWKAVVAELLGTMLLVLVGCGSVLKPAWANAQVNSIQLDSATIVLIALCFGLSVGTIVWTIATASGGHINPAVTIGFLATRKISIVRGLLYIVAQTVGGILGALILKVCIAEEYRGNLGTPGLGDGVGLGQGFGVELLITFILVFTVFSAVDPWRRDTGGSIPLTIGLSIAMCHLWTINWTGSSMNPARAFGPALISGTWDDHWIYWVGPLIGGVFAAWIYEFVFAVNATPAKTRGFFTLHYDDEHYDQHGRRSMDHNEPAHEMKLM